MEFIILVLVFIFIVFVVFMYNKERFSTGVKFPSIPGTIKQNTNGWQFIPTTGYFGPVKINYILSDSKTRIESSLTLKIHNVLQPITADNPNVTLAPIDPYATVFPSYFKDDSSGYMFGFTADTLFSMLSLKGGEIDQNIDKIVFSNITPQMSSSKLYYVSDTSFLTSPTNVLSVSPVSSSDIIPSNAVIIESNKMFVFSCSTTTSVPVSIEFYFIDSVNYGQTMAPNSSLLYPLLGSFTLSFTVPVLYRTPVAIPVDLTSRLFLENQSIDMTNDLLLGTSKKSPTGELLTVSNLTLATCSPGSAVSLTSPNLGTCQLCDGGTYNDNALGYGSCINCGSGSFCPKGATSGILCPIGSYCPPISMSAVTCPSGTSTLTTGSSMSSMCKQIVTITYLVVAGGGGGGSGGGGGGGLLSSSQTLIKNNQIINIIIGAGGAGGVYNNNFGSNGLNSSISGNGITIVTAIGGGGGRDSNGGSSGTGYNGGAGNVSATGGGGGSGGNGFNGIFNSTTYSSIGGNGGIAISSNITGDLVYYAGGGGGIGTSGLGTGGIGGGAGGAKDGIINTGGGGGGGYIIGGSGGSGIVIISIPTSVYSGIYTGTVSPLPSGSNTILKFTGNGSYTV